MSKEEKAPKTPVNHPDPDNLREEVYPRKNGWSCPWHPFQLIAWFFIFFFTGSYYGFLVFYIPGLWRIFGYIIPGVVLLIHIICNFAATYIDAAEGNVRKKFKSGRHLRPFFNSAHHKHVIENMYCNLCQVNVSAKAKHCRTCEKCVYGFDHHCIWLNNCIGRRNYRWFLGTVFSALVGAVVLLVMNLSYFILFFAHRASLRYDCPHPTNVSACEPTLRVLGFAVPDPVFPTLTAILGVLALLAVGLLGHLSLFHIYLLCKGMSTYDFISKVKAEKEARKEQLERLEQEGQLAIVYHGRCSCLRRKLNRVQPTDEENCKGQRDDCSGRESDEESASLRSIRSDGMATFARTPPPSDGSGDSPTDNRTDEQKLRNVAAWAYKMDDLNSNANNNAEKREPVSILRIPTKRCKEPKMASAALLMSSTATETVITMEEPPTDSRISDVSQAVNRAMVNTMLPKNLQPAVSAGCRVGGAHSDKTVVEMERMTYGDDADAGCLAAMMAGYDDGEYGNKCVKKIPIMEADPGSTLAAMAGNWEPEDTPEVKAGLLKAHRPLPPLPSVGALGTSKDEMPRCFQGNRPLPPIHVQHREEYLDSGSTNSLPLPDPCYCRKGLLPKLGASDLTLNKGKATGRTCTDIKKGEGKSTTPDSSHGQVSPGYMAQAQGYMMEDMNSVHCVLPTDSGDSLSPIPRPTTPMPEPKVFVSPCPSVDSDLAVWWTGDADQ